MDLELLALVVDLAGARQRWFGLPLKKRVVQHLIVDVHSSHLRRDAVPLLRGDLFLFVGLFYRSSDFFDAYISEGERGIDMGIVLVCMEGLKTESLDHSLHTILAPGAQTGITV